jgi:LacI family transcriptional regulator, repressor for deo operon, udp, cdd, tsx, nupC, and nupG
VKKTYQLDSELKALNRATMLDVAALAEVSVATVSRVFSGSDVVLPGTVLSVTSAAKALGFRPNHIGKNLRKQHTKTIGVMLPTISHPVFAECLQSIELYSAKKDIAILFSSTGYDEAREEQASEILLQRRVDGLILTVANATTSKLLTKLDSERVPYLLAYNQPSLSDRRYVSVNNDLAARDMVLHLIGLGHKRIQMVLGKSLQSDRSTQRYRGYEKALKECELKSLPPIEVDFLNNDFGALIKRTVTVRNAPTALFCSNDQLAFNVIAQLQRLGLSVPKDISVAGFDGVGIGQLMSQRLTTVLQPNSQIGERAVEALLTAIDHQPFKSLVLPHSILVGDTAIALQS